MLANLIPQLEGIGTVLIIGIIGFGLGHRLVKREDFLVKLAIGLGVLGYSIYLLGQLHLLYKPVIWTFLLLVLAVVAQPLIEKFRSLQFSYPKISWACLGFLPVTLFLSWQLVGALAPEVKFDSLWYHLTEAKVYLMEHQIRAFLPPAQLGQSSVTPRLIDLLYTLQLSLSLYEIGPKLLHWTLGFLVVIGLYDWARKYARPPGAVVAVTLFTSVPIFGWLSQTAYIDLGVAFFALVFLRALFESRSKIWLLGVLMGLYFSTKLWGLILLPIVLGFLIYQKRKPKELLVLLLTTLLVASPWFIEAYLRTGNAVYPVFSSISTTKFTEIGAQNAKDWFLRVYPATLPKFFYSVAGSFPLVLAGLLAIFLGSERRRMALVYSVFGFLAIVAISILPIRDNRFNVPLVLPLYISLAIVLGEVLASRAGKILVILSVLPVLLINFAILLRRSIPALPVALGLESRQSYLYRTIGANIWTFYDGDGYFEKTIKADDKVVLLAHNMFYTNFNFVDGLDLVNKSERVKTAQEVMKFLSDQGFTYVVVKNEVYQLNDWLNRLAKQDIAQDVTWLNRHFTKIYADKFSNVEAYKIIF